MGITFKTVGCSSAVKTTFFEWDLDPQNKKKLARVVG